MRAIAGGGGGPASPAIVPLDVAQLLQDPRRAMDLPAEAVPHLLAACAAQQGALAAVQCALLARWSASPSRESPPGEAMGQGGDRWLGIREADTISGLGERWLYRNWPRVGGAKKFSPKRLRFHEPAFRRWLGTGLDSRTRKGLTGGGLTP